MITLSNKPLAGARNSPKPAQRSFTVRCNGFPTDTLWGIYSVGALDAARNYAAIHLPGFEINPLGQRQPAVIGANATVRVAMRFEAYNQHTQSAAVLWVEEQ